MKYRLAFYCMFLCKVLFAQPADYLLKENSVWTFGDGRNGHLNQSTGLDFNAGALPSAIVSSTSGFGEAQASVCNAKGNLLFYTNGSYVFDANHNKMPHGDSLVGDPASLLYNLNVTSSAAQGALIVPVINNPNQYYVFSLTDYEFSTGIPPIHVSKGHGSELFYSVVDTTLNNGLGDVVTTRRGIFLDSNLNESMVAVAGTHCDVWVLVHSCDDAVIKAYHVDMNGVDPVPVISNYSTAFFNYTSKAGAMKISPDRHKLVVCIQGSAATGGRAELCDFDPATGDVSNAITVTGKRVYQACFSPDNSKIYFSESNWPNDSLLQYNIATQSFARLSSIYSISDLQLGIDGKIYFQSDRTEIGRIEYPNVTGIACSAVGNIVRIPTGTSMYIGLHNLFVKPLVDTIAFSYERGLCFQSDTLVLKGPAGYDSCTWSTGSKDTAITVQAAGIYVLQSNSPCHTRFDTFKVENVNLAFTLGSDTIYCSSDPVVLEIPVPNASYLWQDGSINNSYTANRSGTYIATANKLGCSYTDTVNLNLLNVAQYLGNDTTLCIEVQKIELLLEANVPQSGSCIWSTGDTATSIIAHAGIYWVHVSDSGCHAADTIIINSFNPDLNQDLGADTTICNDQQLVLKAHVPEGVSAIWNTGSTDTTIIAVAGIYWVQVKDSVCQKSDTIAIQSQPCDCIRFIPNAFTPNGDGKNDAFRMQYRPGCPVSNYSLRIYDRWGRMVFNTADIGQGWDGTYNNLPADLGTYMYTVQYTTLQYTNDAETANIRHQKGDVTLIR